ncbi:MAG TPA: pseudouridine synthase [Crocinitomix sp.]|nr:pseudouridine synthase [Crocinitomix sp.]
MTHRHFKIFKPYGYVSQFKHNKNKKREQVLGELFDFPDGTMAIGRLDKDSEGLLLLTTDGKISEAIRAKSVEKEYYVQIDGLITNDAIKSLQQGVEISINGNLYSTQPAKVKRIDIPNLPKRAKAIRDDRHGPTSWLSVTITEGKYRQVRKMTAAVGFPTLRLVRVRVGKISLNNMTIGDVEELPQLI